MKCVDKLYIMEHNAASERFSREIGAIGGHGLAVEGRIRARMQIVPPLSLMGRAIRGILAGTGYASPANCGGRWSGAQSNKGVLEGQ